MKKFDIKDIKEKYKDKSKGPELSIIFGYYRLEIFLTNFLFRHNINPNTITIVSMIIGVIGSGLLIIGPKNFFSVVFASILLIIWAFLDYLDGNIARLRSKVSNKGAFLDLLNSHLIGVLTIISLGFVAPDLSKHFNIEFLLDNSAVIGLTISIIYLVKRLVKMYAYFTGICINSKNKMQKRNDKKLTLYYKKVKYILGSLFEFPRLYTIIYAGALLFEAVSLLLLILLIVHTLSFLSDTYFILKCSN